jgi:hypothetical protein
MDPHHQLLLEQQNQRKFSSSYERHLQRVEEHQQRRRRHRRSALTGPSLSMLASTSSGGGGGDASPAEMASPTFRIGGKMDPGRFVSQHQQQFFILGFHDEERLEHDPGGMLLPSSEIDSPDPSPAASSGCPMSHPMRLSFGSINSAMRNTLSPVREHQDTDIMALMQQRVNDALLQTPLLLFAGIFGYLTSPVPSLPPSLLPSCLFTNSPS